MNSTGKGSGDREGFDYKKYRESEYWDNVKKEKKPVEKDKKKEDLPYNPFGFVKID